MIKDIELTAIRLQFVPLPFTTSDKSIKGTVLGRPPPKKNLDLALRSQTPALHCVPVPFSSRISLEYIFIVVFFFLGPHLWHMDVPMLGV